ncbi:hypothetical protein SCLCIDRAFT_26273 [Scleroderma citrinum Foug A]|uniref:Uncharacterized protein n=1 Tax=Scleroderma citrinum Foug A TaxID=1036808 RepID=A0A0C3DXP8_9AGAM|nr:hypothetical protein SCLCIDRAFT_26273 [Scleroderma citrinum Foug A]
MGQRHQLFNKSVKRLTQSFAALSKAHGIKAAFVMAGSIVNQDGSLGYAYTTPGTEDFFLERCHADANAIISHFKTHIYNRVSLACLTEAFNTDKLGKGKAKERNHTGHDVVDLTSDNDGLVPDNGCEEQEDHTLVKKLLTSWIESLGQSLALGKLFPWKQLLLKLGQNGVVCENWPDVLFPRQEPPSHSKPKGISDLLIMECSQIVAAIRDNGPHRLCFRLDLCNKADLCASKMPVIIGAPPPHDSKLTNVMRMFADGCTDYKGPACLLNTATTRIKKQVGGGKATKTIVLHSDSEGDEPLCFSPSPAPMKLHSMTHKGNTAEPPKPKHVHKRVDVVVPTMTRNRPPSIISLNSSGSEDSNVGAKDRDVSGDTSELFISDDGQALPTRKHKRKRTATSQQSSRAAKRVATSPDTNSTPRADLKAVKASIQVTKKTQFHIESPLDSDDNLDAPENPQSRRTTVPVLAQGVRADTLMNAPSSRVSVEPRLEQYVQSPSQLNEDRTGRSHGSDRVPLPEPLRNEELQSEQPSPHVPEASIALQESHCNQMPRTACAEAVPHKAAIPPSSGRLLDAEEGWVDPHSQFEREQGRRLGLLGPPLDSMCSEDAQFGYDVIPYHIGMNHAWYNPSGRGQDVHYGPYPSRYILPPPFASHRYMGFTNDLEMHGQHGAMGHGPYVDPPQPFRGPHMAEYSDRSGSRDPPAGAYRPGHNPMSSNAEAGPSTIPDGTKCSAVTRRDVILDVSDQPSGNVADGRDG